MSQENGNKNDGRSSGKTMDQRETELINTIEAIGQAKKGKEKIDINKAIKMGEQALNCAYEIFKVKVVTLGKDGDASKKQLYLEELRSNYIKINKKLNNLPGNKRLMNLTTRTKNVINNINGYTGTMILPNLGYYKFAESEVGKGNFEVKDFRAVERKKSPFKRLNKAFKSKNKIANEEKHKEEDKSSYL